MKIKDKMFYFFVEKNENIKREYYGYVMDHIEEHNTYRIKHWFFLLRLNWHYRILKKSNSVYIPNVEIREPKRAKSQRKSSVGRQLPVHFARSIMEFPIVSFDVFDTLLIRSFNDPKDLFYIIGERLNITEFYYVRVMAEKKVKEKNRILHGYSEATITEIYEEIERETGLNAKEGIEAEFNAEMDYCKANPYMKQVYRMCKEQGKKIIIISDMYLLPDMIDKLLAKNGFTGYEKLYVSNEYHCGKGRDNGPIYEYVGMKYNLKDIVHIGDNKTADVDNALRHGLHVRHYISGREEGKGRTTHDMSELILSAYTGLVNYHLYNGAKQYTKYYEYGFICGGLYVLGYCNWIMQKVKEHGIDKVLFLARDGAIYKTVFEKINQDTECDYFLWSRIPNTKYTYRTRRAFAYRGVLESLAKNESEVSYLDDFLEQFDLSFLNEYLQDYALIQNAPISFENIDRIQSMLADHYDDILERGLATETELHNYITKKIGNSKNVAFVDVGWLGSAPLALKSIIENDMKLQCKVRCFCAAIRSTSRENVSAKMLKGDTEAYMFSSRENRDMFASHTKENVTAKYGLNYVWFEMLTQAQMPGFGDFIEGGKYRFQTPEVENYEKIKEMHRGIIDFCNAYIHTFSKDSYLLNISGCDAYRPFRFLAQRKKEFFNEFDSFVFPRGVTLKDNLAELESIANMK